MMKKRIVAFLLAFMMVLPVMVPAMAAESTTTVKVAVMNYPNFIEREKDGTVSGYAVEYLNDIADYTGWSYEYMDMSFSDALEAVHDGSVDIVVGVQKAPGRDALYDFSQIAMGENSALLCVRAQDNRYAYQEYKDFGGLRVGGITGSAYIELCKNEMAERNIAISMTEFATDQQARDALDAGLVDALMMGTIRYTNDYKVIARLTPTDMYFCLQSQ